jgi:hypothetical protein
MSYGVVKKQRGKSANAMCLALRSLSEKLRKFLEKKEPLGRNLSWPRQRLQPHIRGMSALPPKADICGAQAHVRYGPKADIAG